MPSVRRGDLAMLLFSDKLLFKVFTPGWRGHGGSAVMHGAARQEAARQDAARQNGPSSPARPYAACCSGEIAHVGQ